MTKKYYILKKNSDDETPFLTPTQNTISMLDSNNFNNGVLQFKNGWAEENAEDGIVEKAGDILFGGNIIIVNDNVKNAFLKQNVKLVEYVPAIYIDPKGNWNEYWYLNIFNSLDCWSKEESKFDPNSFDMFDLYEVEKYVLSKEFLGRIDDDKKQIIVIDNVLMPITIISEDLKNILESMGIEGVIFTNIEDHQG